ncbi:hypothetical protein MHU86_12660 [Fragilaria crotonensis]|nr:hypothetical protein MHU86_12660 [Fragilaria crotonensis]
MAHKRTQNEENEDPETECVGQIGGVQKKRRAGNNVNTRATRSSRAAELETPSHEGDSNNLWPDWKYERCTPNVVDNGRPPSRDFPFVGGGRGSQVGNGNVGTGANVVNNGGFHPETIHLLTAGVAARLETAMLLELVRTLSTMEGFHPETIHLLTAGMAARLETAMLLELVRTLSTMEGFHPETIPSRQVDGQQRLVGDGNGLHGLQEWTAQEVQEGGGIEQHGVTLLPQQQERRAMSYRTAKGLTKKNIRDRIQVTVKTVIFRGVKFITCKEYFDMVMQVILDQEKPADTPQFVRMYKTIVMGALNTKRSTCEQSAQEAAMKLLKIKNHVDEVDPPPYSMDTLCKLRQSQTVEEKEAFLWFAGELLECVCGKRGWGNRKKYKATISDAKSNDTGAPVVTVSDEAFALLLYDAYIDKWIKRYHEDRRGDPRSKRIVGKYTHTDGGTSNEYGGWTEEGILQFNVLCEMVQEDRASRNARDAEEWLMNSLRQQAGGAGARMGQERETDHTALQRSLERTNQPVVNAFIEL